MDQLTLLCIFNSFNLKNYFYIDLDLLHFEKKKKKCHGFIAFWGENNQFLIFNVIIT